MKRLGFILFLNAFVLAGCSVLRASPAQTSPFLSHGSELKPWYDRAPWDAVWSSDPGKIMAKSPDQRTIYIAAVDTQYLNYKMNAEGKEVKTEDLSPEDVKAMTDFLRQSFVDAINSAPESNLKIVDKPSQANLVLELALIELTPTTVAENVVADVVGVALPGSKAIEEAASVGGQAAGGALAAGSIAIEFKISDGASGVILAEAKDRELDPASILPNVKDFERYGWSRHTVKEWAKQFAEIFSTDVSTKIDPESTFSIAPW